MESIKQSIVKIPRKKLIMAAVLAGVVLLAALIIWGCISSSNAENMREKYAASRQSIGEELYGAMYMMTLEHEDANLAGADAEGEIIPTMKEYYTRALALSGALANAYGDRYLVMDDGLILQLDQAFTAYDDAFNTGKSTDEAHALMAAALAGVQEALSDHYDGDARLKARK